jgi:Tfp pilus assembly protein PilN
MSINLLPPEEKISSVDKQIISRKALCGFLCSLAVIVIINMFFGIVLMNKKAVVANLEKRYKIYQDLQGDIKGMDENVAYLNREFALLERFFPKKFFWSEKLLELSKKLPEEIWFQRLSISGEKTKETLKINGSVANLSLEEKPLAILNRFIKTLKDDQSFSENFSEIRLIDVKSSSINNKEILEFNLELPIKK